MDQPAHEVRVNESLSLTEIRERMAQEHALHLRLGRESMDAARRVGHYLTLARRRITTGSFEAWVRSNATFSPRQAYRYLELFKSPAEDSVLGLGRDFSILSGNDPPVDCDAHVAGPEPAPQPDPQPDPPANLTADEPAPPPGYLFQPQSPGAYAEPDRSATGPVSNGNGNGTPRRVETLPPKAPTPLSVLAGIQQRQGWIVRAFDTLADTLHLDGNSHFFERQRARLHAVLTDTEAIVKQGRINDDLDPDADEGSA
jgi:hypothetical protein